MQAYIVVKLKNRYVGSFVNSKGGLQDTGRLLYKYFRQSTKVQNLLNLGDLRQLGYCLKPPTLISQYGYRYDKNRAYYDLPQHQRDRLLAELSRATISFIRDRGDGPQPVHQWSSKQALVADINSQRSLIKVPIYLYENHKWHFTQNHNFRILRKKDWSL